MELHTIELLTIPYYCTIDLYGIEDHAFHAVSSPLAGTGQREGGEKTQPFNRFQSRLGTFG